MKKMKINYHGHTSRCFHATGIDEEYVLCAIKAGYDAIGFSDHMPVPDIEVEKGFKARMGYSKRKEYVDSVLSLKERYKDKIKIFLAYECEYFEELNPYYEELLNNEADYLIFGNHFMHYENGAIFNKKGERRSAEFINLYKEKALKALKSGYFSIMAHPDFYLRFQPWCEASRECAEEICKCAEENNVVLEINEMCFRRDGIEHIGDEYRYGYPTKYFFDIAKTYNLKYVIGVDAHNPDDYLHQSHQMAIDFAKDMGIDVIDEIEFKKI